ncbi:MAG: CIA30 family protein [Trueperaceae bacterium]|nr:CIA30 family protein [Trueperaceae bacterium]
MNLFEFKSAKSVENWLSQDDPVMGGKSNSRLRFLAPGHVQFEGRVSLENNGGFAQVKYDKTSFDLSAFSGLELRALGDRKNYQLRLTTTENKTVYTQRFLANENWHEHRLAFTDFKATYRGEALPDAPPLDTANIRSLGLMLSDKQAGEFCLMVSSLKAY